MKKTLYVDIDDTVKDTERYIRRVMRSNGISCPKTGTIYSKIGTPEGSIIEEVLCNHDAIPFKESAKSSLELLFTEYNVVFYSHYHFQKEKECKYKLAKLFKRPIILEEFSDSKSVDMSDAYFVDDRNEVLMSSNAERKFELYSPYMFDMTHERDKDTLIVDWYSLTNILMGVNLDEYLRRFISSRVPQQRKFSGQ